MFAHHFKQQSEHFFSLLLLHGNSEKELALALPFSDFFNSFVELIYVECDFTFTAVCGPTVSRHFYGSSVRQEQWQPKNIA